MQKKNFRLESYRVGIYCISMKKRETERQSIYETRLAITSAKSESEIAPTHLAATQKGKVGYFFLIFARNKWMFPKEQVFFSSQEFVLLPYSTSSSR